MGVEPRAGGLGKDVNPARFIAVCEALNPRDAAVVPVAKLPRLMVSAHANDADKTRRAQKTESLLHVFIGGAFMGQPLFLRSCTCTQGEALPPRVSDNRTVVGEPQCANQLVNWHLPIQQVRCSYGGVG